MVPGPSSCLSPLTSMNCGLLFFRTGDGNRTSSSLSLCMEQVSDVAGLLTAEPGIPTGCPSVVCSHLQLGPSHTWTTSRCPHCGSSYWKSHKGPRSQPHRLPILQGPDASVSRTTPSLFSLSAAHRSLLVSLMFRLFGQAIRYHLHPRLRLQLINQFLSPFVTGEAPSPTMTTVAG